MSSDPEASINDKDPHTCESRLAVQAIQGNPKYLFRIIDFESAEQGQDS